MSGDRGQELDWALIGGLVHRDAVTPPEPLAIGMRDGAIVFLGSDQELRARYGEQIAVRRLSGQHVYPGFADAHGHLYHLGSRFEEVRLEGRHSLEGTLNLVHAAVQRLPAKEWILGGGWDESYWSEGRGPTVDDLDPVAKGRPACLLRHDCHAAWVSSATLALAGIDASTPEIAGGRIVRDARGKPTGVLVDRAMELVMRILPPPAPETVLRRVQQAAQACAQAGITAVHDMGVDAPTLAALRQLDREGRLAIRVYAALRDVPALWDEEFARGPQMSKPGMRLTVRAVKLFADGALGSRGAALFEDYTDDPGNRGLPLLAGQELIDRLTRATRAGYQSCVHAIGDRANREVLDAFARMATDGDGAAFVALRPRIEHAQVLAESDIPRFAGLGVIASVQPLHAVSDRHWAEERLGRERARYAYAYGSLARARARLCFGSDFPVESYDVRYGLMAACSRRPPGFDSGVAAWNPSEQVSAAVAIAAYTSGPAYASFGENERGRIAEGYLADLTVWDRDLSEGAETLFTAKVVATIVGGKVEHSGLGGRYPLRG